MTTENDPTRTGAVEVTRDKLRELYAAIQFATPPWRVVASDGKPIIVSDRGGNLFRGFIATWKEADLIVAVVNALPELLATATTADTRRTGASDAGAMRAALRPFADKATAWEQRHRPTARDATQIQHRLGDFRAARDALAGRHIVTCPFKSGVVEKSPCPVCGLSPYGNVCAVNDLEIG